MEDKMPFDFESMIPQNIGDKHIACVLLVDTSGSMMGAPINELNNGLIEFGKALEQDAQARGCADVCVISFNSYVQMEVPFCPAMNYSAPKLTANGLTSMNEAIIAGLNALEERKNLYKSYGIPYYRPWIFLMTDGEPTDTNREGAAKQMLGDAIRNKKVNFFPMGIGNANIQKLMAYTEGGSRMVLKATASNFKEAFVWLSSSISAVTNSFDAEKVSIPSPPPMIEIEVI